MNTILKRTQRLHNLLKVSRMLCMQPPRFHFTQYNVYDLYMHRTDEQKQAMAKAKRKARV